MKAATAVIDRRALRHNLQQVRVQAPGSNVIAVVKANAYGHGLLETAHTMEDADCFGVARIGYDYGGFRACVSGQSRGRGDPLGQRPACRKNCGTLWRQCLRVND
ncbi:Alanine racemase, N-terminal domain [Xenorhabdus koppenhoeferi]|uniref:Alanine racemase, biosynthetic n=1 Tax=Xenorhabdus koppenhoeferi TaxID=351659 RepID=A0A1I7FR34_9GAMM|nr:Alanine racemase, N-terminal domain [Xenorhabdus koppenhoeferi]